MVETRHSVEKDSEILRKSDSPFFMKSAHTSQQEGKISEAVS